MEFLLSLFKSFGLYEGSPNAMMIIMAASTAASVTLGVIAVIGIVAVYAERKISAHMQSRVGPMHVGWHGVLQTVADGIKLFLKEDIIPALADRWLFILAPLLVILGAVLSLAVIPFSSYWVPADINIGVLYLLATSSLVAIGLIMAGWASHNKWSLYGAMRAAAQFLSYEVPVALHIIPPVLLASSLHLTTIVEQQQGGFLGIGNWNLWNPFCFLSFIAYYVSSLAETNRLPFDLPESESELVAGVHTEYTGMRFAFFFIAEYTDLFVVSAVASILFLGGWHGPFGLQSLFILLLKITALIFVAMWLRWTLPRLRIDQLMTTCWKILIPLGLINIIGVSLWIALWG